MGWKKVKIGEFLFERKGLIEPHSKELFSFRKIEKIDFSEGKIFLCDYSPTKTKQIIVKNGDFVFSGLNIEKGAVAINDYGQDLVVSANYSTCEVDYSKIDQEFLKIFIKSPSFKKLLTDNLKKDYGFTRPKHLKNLEVALPSIEEQRRIAEKLKVCEEKQKRLQQQIENQRTYLKNLKKQILQDAVEGKLTKEWREQNPNVEPASKLLKKIKQEKEKLISEKKIKKEKTLPPINKDEMPFELPNSWSWTRLGDVTSFFSGNNFDSNDFKKGLGAKCIKITNAGVGELIETDDVLPQEFLNKYSEFLVYEGDLILALTRPYILDGLKISLCNKSYNRSLLNQRVAAIRSLCRDKIDQLYIYSFLRTSFVLTIYQSMFAGKGQQPNLKKSDVTELLFPLPPTEEQLAIVSKLQTLTQKLDEAEKQIEKSLETSKLLTKAILSEAFSGNAEKELPTIEQLIEKAEKSCEEEGFVNIKKIVMFYGISLVKNSSVKKAQIEYDNDNDRFFIHANDLNDHQSIAHELIHYIEDHDKVKKLGMVGRKDEYSLSGKDENREKEAEKLAAEILTPEKLIIAFIQDKGVNACGFVEDKILKSLAKKFKISEPSMNFRLNSLGYKTKFKNYYTSSQ